MAETFPEKLKSIRLSKIDMFGRTMSQERASKLFNVSLSCYRGWEHNPPRSLPDTRSREVLSKIWPELFGNNLF